MYKLQSAFVVGVRSWCCWQINDSCLCYRPGVPHFVLKYPPLQLYMMSCNGILLWGTQGRPHATTRSGCYAELHSVLIQNYSTLCAELYIHQRDQQFNYWAVTLSVSQDSSCAFETYLDIEIYYSLNRRKFIIKTEHWILHTTCTGLMGLSNLVHSRSKTIIGL